jgi:hypothetical protein
VCFRVPVWGFAGGGAEKNPAGDYSMNTHKDFDADKVWLPSGKKVDVDEKIRYYFPPSLEIVHMLDEVVYEDPVSHTEKRIGLER